MSRLVARTRELMLASPLSTAELSIQAGLPYHWLHGLRYKQISNPSIDRVEKLYQFLTGQQVGLDQEPMTDE